MKKILFQICLGALASGVALAATNEADLSVTASITSNCNISTAAVAFGAYDPIAGGTVDALGTVTVTCTSDVEAPPVTLGQGMNDAGGTPDAPQRRLSDGAGTPHYLIYKLYRESNHATFWGNTLATSVAAANGDGAPHDLTVYGRIAAGQNTAPAGNYSDTVTATVTF